MIISQNKNVEWYHERMGSLAASNFAAILRFMSGGQKSPEGLIAGVFQIIGNGVVQVSLCQMWHR